MLVNFHNN